MLSGLGGYRYKGIEVRVKREDQRRFQRQRNGYDRIEQEEPHQSHIEKLNWISW